MDPKIDPNQRKKGKVKGVPSGDTVVFAGPISKEGIPLEKTIRLNGINAPRLGDPEKPDEPFAFEAREYLRKLLVGKEVFFYIENKFNEREYGRVILDDQDVAVGLLSEGYAKLMEEMKNKPINFDKYKTASDSAKDKQKGIWGPNASKSTRTLQKIENPKKFVDKYKGQKLKVLVEDVKSALFVCYVPEVQGLVKIALSSIYTQFGNPQAAQEVRMFLEPHFLNREAVITINNWDEKREFYTGCIESVENPKFDVLLELIKNGYAKLNKEAVMEMESSQFKSLKAAQDEAQKKGLRIWADYEGGEKKSSGTSSSQSSFTGRVIEVHSGDCVTVENPKGELIRLNLSNVRAPAIGNPKRNEAPKPWAFEAKELVRHHTIGKKVKVEIEFTKTIKPKFDEEEEKSETKKSGPTDERTMTFGTIILPNEKNLSVILAEAGYGQVNVPKSEDDFTQYLKALKDGEDHAKSKKLGQWSSNKPISYEKFNDFSGPKMSVKAKQFYEFIKDEPKLKGVVDAVLSGSLFKIRIDERNCFILFSLAGLRTLQADKNIPQYEHFAKAAVNFSKENAIQRDVEIDVVSVSPRGLFQGVLWINKKNYGHLLLENGLAYAEALNKNEQRYLSENKEIEKAAQAKKAGIWGADIIVGSSARSSSFKAVNETKSVTVVEAYDPNEFFVRYNDDAKTLANIENDLKGFKSDSKLEQPVKKGTPCVALFSDGSWYRAKIEKVGEKEKYTVFFSDYGNTETVHYNDIRKMPSNLLSIKPQAIKCSLAFIRSPTNGTETYDYASEKAHEWMFEKKFSANFVYEDGTTRHCILTEKTNAGLKDSLNLKFLNEGLARVDRDAPSTEEQKRLVNDAEDNAKEAKKGGWQHDDFVEEEDEDF